MIEMCIWIVYMYVADSGVSLLMVDVSQGDMFTEQSLLLSPLLWWPHLHGHTNTTQTLHHHNYKRKFVQIRN